MTTQLRDIRPGEVSLVRRGANRRRFLLAKADVGDVDRDLVALLAAPADHEDKLLDAIRKSGGDETVEKAAAALARIGAAVKDAYGDRGVPADLLKAMQGMLDDDTDDGDDLTSDDVDDDEDLDVAKADLAARDEIFKADFTDEERRKMADSGDAMPDGSYPIPNQDYLKRAIRAVGRGKNNSHTAIRDHIVRRAKALGATDLLPDSWNVKKEETVTETAQAVPVKKDDGTWDLSAVPEDQRPTFEAFMKAHDDELAELRKQTETEKAEAIAKAESAEKIAKEEREIRETREFVAKSAGLTALAKTDDEFGKVLYAVSKAEADGHLPEGTLAKLDEVLNAANEQVAKGVLYAEMGRTGGAGGGDAQSKVEAAAAELRKSDPSLTKEQAFAKALDNDPSLYVEMKKEQV